MTVSASDVAHGLMARPRKNGPGWLVLCPVHRDKHPSLSIRDGEGGKLLVKCFSGCDHREVLKTLREMELLDGESSPARPTPEPEHQTDIGRKADRASEMWDHAAPVREGDPVGKYLRGRGITFSEYPSDLRCHPSLAYWEMDDSGKPVKTGTFPAMLAVVRSPQGRPVGIHRTWVMPDGSGKAPVQSPKKIFKVHDLVGGSVRLFPVSGDTLAIAEGLETALSVRLLYGEPCWSCISAHGMEGFIPPEGVSTVRIFADRDINKTGERAALALADRLRIKGKAARIFLPEPRYGLKADFNDILLLRAATRTERNPSYAPV